MLAQLEEIPVRSLTMPERASPVTVQFMLAGLFYIHTRSTKLPTPAISAYILIVEHSFWCTSLPWSETKLTTAGKAYEMCGVGMLLLQDLREASLALSQP